jgi:hypothetical protein
MLLMITRHIVAGKIFSYLNHEITLSTLVDWCETVMMNEEIKEEDSEAVTEVVARLGLADVKNFGLLWEECDELLAKLGYQLNFDLLKVA